MEQVGSQVKLPFARAVAIAIQGIRIRFGRSLVTVSGVALGVAFLMSNLTGYLITRTVAHERELRQTVNLMFALVKSEIGVVPGKRLAIAACGTLSAADQLLIERLVAAGPAQVRGAGLQAAGVMAADWHGLGTGAALVLVLGDGRQCPVSIPDLAAGMTQRVLLDSVTDRTFPGPSDPAVRRELFFGKQLEQQAVQRQQEAARARVRTLWIVIVSLMVTVIGVANSLLMSVTERFREIGTMKCLGALSGFIRRLFLIESALIGLAGSTIGAALGALLPLVAYGMTWRFSLVFGTLPYGWLLLDGAIVIVVGTVLAVVAALYPAQFAARMLPAAALRSTV